MDKYCTLVFLRRNNEILLAMKKRGFGEGHWNGVGGKIEPDETLEEALVRETEEEIDVTPLVWEKVAEHDFLMDSDSDKPYHLYVHTFVCDKWSGEPSESEEMKPKWFLLDNIPYQQMWADDPFWLPQVLRGEKVDGKYTFNSKNKLLSYDVTIVPTLPNKIPTHKPS
jgi:8-oxo-dGTP pyrophosphatase MutT (NUDIX family)